MRAISRELFLRFALFGALFFAVFPARWTVYQFTAGFHEYETAFLYWQDLFLFSVIGLAAAKINLLSILRNLKALVIFLIFVAVSGFLAFNFGLGIYASLRLVILAAFGLAVAGLIDRNLRFLNFIFGGVLFLAVCQSLIAIFQFANQGSVGLSFLGEPVIDSGVAGVARAPIAGTYILRAYGTFPHPNVLAAFLVFALLAAAYFYVRLDYAYAKDSYDSRMDWPRNLRVYLAGRRFYLRIFLAVLIMIIGLGLALTFSRAGWLALGAGLIFLIAGLFFRKESCAAALRLLLLIIVIFFSVIKITGFAVLPRASFARTEPAVSERLLYNRIGWQVISDHPIFGVGPGNQVLYAVKKDLYRDFGLRRPAVWQPIHNFYVLQATEIGLIGAGAFFFFLLSLIYRLRRRFDLLASGVGAIFFALLIFGLFDHFLWTLQSGRVMLWLVIGVLLAMGRLAKEAAD